MHVVLQEFQAAALILHKMDFQLSIKVVIMHLGNSNAKSYLCNGVVLLSLFHSRLACHILNLIDKHGITDIPAPITTHLNVKANYLVVISFLSGTCFPA